MKLTTMTELDVLLLARQALMANQDKLLERISRGKRCGSDISELQALDAAYDCAWDEMSRRIMELKQATRECGGKTLLYYDNGTGYNTHYGK